MPVTTRKTAKGYTNATPGGVKGRGMTKRNAMAQKRLLNAVDHGWKPDGETYRDRVRRMSK